MSSDSDDAKLKLPQNIQALIGEIGEKQVLLRLYLLSMGTDWQVFHNLGEAGYDILLLNAATGARICIEAKTRQKLYTTGKHPRTVQFFLTDGEYQACDFLIAYHLDQNEFYVVPKGDLKPVTVNGKVRWRFTVSLDRQGQPADRLAQYRGGWGRLHADFNGRTL